MTDEERRAAVMQLRELRTSPQALGRALRQKAAATDEAEDQSPSSLNENGIPLGSTRSKKPSGKTTTKATSTADLYKELGL